MTIRVRYPHLPDNLDLTAFLGTEIRLDDTLVKLDNRQCQALASLDRLFEYQRRLETYVRILESRQKDVGSLTMQGTH